MGRARAPAEVAAPHLASVDVLRAAACLWVVLFHLALFWGGTFWYGFGPLEAAAGGPAGRALVWASRLGLEGVGLFLVLSGFCLYYPLVRRAGVARASLELGPYARRRARRILPPYYASLALIVGLAALPGTAAVVMRPVTTLDVFAHLGLVHNLIPPTLWTINGVYWSLALEAQLYVVFPLLVWLGRRLGALPLGALGIATSLLWLFVLRAAQQRGLTGEDYAVLFEALPARLGEFTAGMAAAAIVAEGRPVPRWALALAATLWAPACHASQVARWFQYPFERPINAVSYAALLVLLSRLPASAYRPAPVRLLQGIGVVSYSIYLAHQPLILLLRTPLWSLRLPFWQLAALGLGLSTALGALFYVAFERPWVSPGAARASKRAPEAVSG